MKQIVIIGAGISGLAAAALLGRQGHTVTLLEKKETTGGRAGSWEKQGFRFDTGPSWYLMPEVFDHFYELMGSSTSEQLDLSRLDPGYRAYFEGQQEPFDLAGTAEAFESLVALDPEHREGITAYVESARDTYNIALKRFLYGSFRSAKDLVHPSVLRRLPQLVGLLSRSLDQKIQAHTADPRMRRVLGYPAVFLGGSPLKTPAMYHLMTHLDVNAGVLYPQGGFNRVVESIETLARQSGATIITGTDAQKILVDEGVAGGVEYIDSSGERHRIYGDTVVAACDLHFVEHQLLDKENRDHSERWWAKADSGPGAVLAMLGVEGELPELAHHTLFFADDWEKGFAELEGNTLPETPSIYIGKPSASDASVAPDGYENLFVLIPVAARPEFGHGGEDGTGDEQIERFVDRAIEQVAEWANIPDLAERIVVRRTVSPADFQQELGAWKGTALGPSHILTQSAVFRASNRSKKVKNLLFAGSSTIPGIGVPMCLISAELVVKEMMGDKSMKALKSL